MPLFDYENCEDWDEYDSHECTDDAACDRPSFAGVRIWRHGCNKNKNNNVQM